MAGDHVPVMPLVEVVGNAGMTVPEQIGPTAAKVGVVALTIEKVAVEVPAQVEGGFVVV